MAGDRGRVALNPPEFFAAPDGTRLSYRQLGEGRPLLLVHGFFSTGTANWVGNRHARLLVERGHRLVLPDLRAHGRSETPHDPAAYPPDVLVTDTLALLDHLGIDDLDAVGYSLGARTVIRMLVHGAPIRRAVFGGQGLEAMEQVAGQARTSFVRLVLGAEGTSRSLVREWFVAQWNRKSPEEQEALRLLLASSVGTPLAQLRAISVPALVIMGDGDEPDDGRALADALPHGRYREIVGDHVRAAGNPDFATAVEDFLDEGVY